MVIVQYYLKQREDSQVCLSVVEQRLQIAKKNMSLMRMELVQTSEQNILEKLSGVLVLRKVSLSRRGASLRSKSGQLGAVNMSLHLGLLLKAKQTCRD